MGLAASQMRMLTLTKRTNDVENKLMHNSNERLALSRESSAISAQYSSALNSTKIVYGTADSNTALAYSMFNNANSSYALTDSSGAVLVSSSDAASWGLDSTGQMPDKDTFVKKAASVTDEVYQKYKDGIQGADTIPGAGSETSPLYTINYKDDTVFEELSNVSGKKDANGTSFAYASSSGTSKIVDFSVKAGETETIANLKNFTCNTVNDAGNALLAVLEDNFGDNWDSVEADMQAAATLAKQATIDFYNMDHDNYIERTTGHSSVTLSYDNADQTARVVTTGDDTDDDASAQKVADGSLNVGTGSSDQNSYVDTTEMVKYFLSQFDLYASAISTGDISQDDVAAINTAAGTNDYVINAISANDFDTYSSKVDDSKITNTDGRQKIKYEEQTVGSDEHLTIYGLKQNKRTSDTSNKCTVAGATTEKTKEVSESDKIEYYINLYKEMTDNGYKVNDNITNSDYLEDQIGYGNIVIRDVSTWTKETVDGAASDFITIDDDDAADQAKADYEAEKDKIDYKETILDTEQNNLDTERSALNTEKESVQKLLDSNVKKFSLFQNA